MTENAFQFMETDNEGLLDVFHFRPNNDSAKQQFNQWHLKFYSPPRIFSFPSVDLVETSNNSFEYHLTLLWLF